MNEIEKYFRDFTDGTKECIKSLKFMWNNINMFDYAGEEITLNEWIIGETVKLTHQSKMISGTEKCIDVVVDVRDQITGKAIRHIKNILMNVREKKEEKTSDECSVPISGDANHIHQTNSNSTLKFIMKLVKQFTRNDGKFKLVCLVKSNWITLSCLCCF